MRVLYAMNSGQYGGMEQHVANLVEGMISKGHEVHVWCPEGPVSNEIKNHGAIYTEKIIKLDIDPFYIKDLYDYLRKNQIEIIHAHELKSVTNSVLAGFIAGTKIRIGHTHTPISEWNINPILKHINFLGYSWLINLFATFEIALTPSRFRIKQKEGIWKKKLKVLYPGNGLPTQMFINSPEDRLIARHHMCEKYGFDPTRFLIMQIGRISKEKGHAVMLSAFAKLCLDDNFRKNTQLIFAGGGPLENDIKKDISNKNLNVVVTGRFDEADRFKLFATPDLFVHPTLAEGWGIVPVESMLSKNVTLISDLEVLREVCGDYPAYFTVNDVSDLANHMRAIYENYSEYKKNLDPGYNFVISSYSMDKFVDSYESFYKELLV